jgi:hypothetical protein
MNGFFRRWGGVVIITVLFLGSWVGQFFTQILAMQNEAMTHGEVLRWSDFWPQFFASTFENWQSEFLQLAVQAIFFLALADKFFRADQNATKEDIDRVIDVIENNRKAENE